MGFVFKNTFAYMRIDYWSDNDIVFRLDFYFFSENFEFEFSNFFPANFQLRYFIGTDCLDSTYLHGVVYREMNKVLLE